MRVAIIVLAGLLVAAGAAEARQARPAALEPGSRAIEIAVPEGGGSGAGIWWVLSPRTQFGLEGILQLSSTDVPGSDERRNQWAVGVGPALKRQFGVVGPVVPYWRTGALLQAGGGSGSTQDVTSVAIHGGIGADWFVHDRVGLGGHTGLRAAYGRVSASDAQATPSREAFTLATFRSALALKIYF